jgi:hypothetical protein
MPYYLITKHLAEPSSLPLNAYVFNKIEPKDIDYFIKLSQIGAEFNVGISFQVLILSPYDAATN